MSREQIQFEDFELDCDRYELLRDDQSIKLEKLPMELLILLVERRGLLVTRQEIAERLWGQNVFVDIEHGINTAVRKLRTALGDNPEQARFVQTVTGKGYRFVATTTVIPSIAESGSNGQKPEAMPPAGLAAAHDGKQQQKQIVQPNNVRRRMLWLLACCLIAALMIGTASWTMYSRASRNRIAAQRSAPPIRSLAILPLENLSGDPNQEYFADGMTEELTTALARDSNLQIVSRTSVMQYKKARRPLPEIARALHVDAIVEGSVARSGDEVHMTLQLIRGDADSHVWAESYDRDADDVALPDEAARAIAKRLDSVVASVPAIAHVNPEAHDALLQGKYLWFSDDQVAESGKYFQKAIDIQPDYALGWAWLANYYGAATDDGFLDPRESLKLLDQAANRAMQLDPNLAESHQAMAWEYLFGRWDLVSADRELLQAISLDPHDAELYHLRSELLGMLNRHKEAIDAENKAMELDPFERPWGLVLAYLEARQYDAAIADGELRRKDYPADFLLLYMMMFAYLDRHMDKEAVETWIRAKEVHGRTHDARVLRRIYAEGGIRAVLRWQLSRWEWYGKKNYVCPLTLAKFHARLGEADTTLALLEEGYERRAPDVLRIQSDPAYDFLHADPRYRALVQKVGLRPAL